MAMIPLKQEIVIKRALEESDGWGNKKVSEEEIAWKCRVDDIAETIENVEGKETVVSLKIILDKLADIGYEDTINYVDELGVLTSKKPEKIQPLRGFNGKALFTVVYI